MATLPAYGRSRWDSVVRIGLLALGVLLVLAVIGAGVALASFDPAAYRGRLAEAVYRATGRHLTIAGTFRVGLFNGPRIKATDVSLSNLPDGSRPQMAHVDELKARLALLPLLVGRLQIARLELIRPDILLEIDAEGHANWRFHRPAPAARAATAPAEPAAGPHRHLALDVQEVDITDGVLTLFDARTGRRIPLQAAQLVGRHDRDSAPLTFSLTATEKASATGMAAFGTALHLNGTAGPARPQTAGRDDGPQDWPVQLDLAVLGAQLRIAGTLTTPLPRLGSRITGYDLSVTASVQDLSTLEPLLPGAELPPFQGIHLKAGLTGSGRGWPTIRSIDLSGGQSDLGAVVPGLTVDQVSLAAESEDKPVQVRASGSYAQAPFKMAATLGPLAALSAAGQSASAYPVSLDAGAAGATLKAKGTLQHPRALRGLDLAVVARVPDLGAFAPLLHRRLPAFQALALDATLTDGPDSLRQGIALPSLHVTMPGSDATGTLAISWAPHLSVNGDLHARHLDAGVLLSAIANPVAPPPAIAAPSGPATPAAAPSSVPAPPAAASSATAPLAAPPAAASPAAAPPAAATTTGPQLSDQPIRFDRLLALRSDLRLDAQDVIWPDAVWHNLSAHLLAIGTRLRLEPFAADLPTGHMTAALDLDMTRPVPAMAISMHAPGVAAAPFLALFDLPAALNGPIEVSADLQATGRSLRDLAASASGPLGLAMVGGSVDGGAAQSWLSDVIRRAGLPVVAQLGGHTDVECFALRADLANGQGSLRALALQTRLLSLIGNGAVNLVAQTLDLRLRALVSVGIAIAVPFDVSGPLLRPKVRANIAAAAGESLGAPGGLMIGRAGGDGAGLGGPTCASELSLARNGRAGPMPAAPAAAIRPPAPSPVAPERALRAFRWLSP